VRSHGFNSAMAQPPAATKADEHMMRKGARGLGAMMGSEKDRANGGNARSGKNESEMRGREMKCDRGGERE
jgi:hypothetical protein